MFAGPKGFAIRRSQSHALSMASSKEIAEREVW